MVDPLTISIASLVVVGVSSLFHLLGPACEWWKIRFKAHKVINYEAGSAEYEMLWAILAWPAHVQSALVSRRERRQLYAESESEWIITQTAKFRWECAPTTLESHYRLRLVHGRDDLGRQCIHFICFWEEELKFFQRQLLGERKAQPSQLVLLSCSTK